MIRHLRNVSSVGAVLIVAAGWAAAAQTGGHAAPAPQATQGVANPLQGFSQNSDQPIKIESTSLEVRDKDHVATFIGNVHVVQGDTTMKCKTLVVFYDEKPVAGAAPAAGAASAAPKKGQSGGNQQIKRLEAKGGVVITQADQTATGDSGIFEMKTNTATLIGNVVVTQGQNVVRGDRMVMDMTTGVARVESDKSNKGQVKALFLPNAQPAGPNAPGTGAKEPKPSAPLKIN
jgi:lipopolysaccharide export system protein LptA